MIIIFQVHNWVPLPYQGLRGEVLARVPGRARLPLRERDLRPLVSDDPGAVERLHGGHGRGVSGLDSAPALGEGTFGARKEKTNAGDHRSDRVCRGVGQMGFDSRCFYLLSFREEAAVYLGTFHILRLHSGGNGGRVGSKAGDITDGLRM